MQSIIDSNINPILRWCALRDLEWQFLGRNDERYRNVRFGDTAPELRDARPDWEITVAGSSGWNPVDQKSEWIGIDVDALDHTAGVAASAIDEIITRCTALPYVQIQRSKGGQGVHLFARFDPDHQPHAAVRSDHKRNAERVVRRIEQDTGLKLIGGDADCFGLIRWVWCAEPKPDSFALLHEATEFIPDELPLLPPRAPVPAVNDVDAVEFDPDHRRIIDEWAESGYAVQTDVLADGRCVVRIHTKATGVPTISEGQNPRKPNAFAFPVRGGGFAVYRFNDVAECAPWFKTRKGMTCCLIGVRDVETCARFRLRFHKGEYLGTVAEIAAVLPDPIETDGLEDRPAALKQDHGHWIVTAESRKVESMPVGWVKSGYKALYFVDAPAADDSPAAEVYSIIGEETESGREAGDFMRIEDGLPVYYSERRLENALRREGRNSDQIQEIKNSATVLKQRTAHLRPSRIEGEWLNIGARLKVSPLPGPHPTWDDMERHAGMTLTPHLDAWCAANGINSGGDWLRLWRCVAFQRPDRPTPFLTFVSKLQGTGKTTYVNSLKLLVDGGIAGANGVLTKGSNFNAHVMRSWLALIVERDIARDGTYDMLKAMITDDDCESEAKFQQATLAKNYCHFAQTTNHLRYCPIEHGDTRIVVIRVQPLETYLDRDELSERLTAEAPHYLHTLMTTPLPPPAGRLWLPILNTPERQLLIEMRTSPVERFVHDFVDEIPHQRIPAAEFVERFQQWYVETLGKGETLGKQAVYAQLRMLDSTITYVPDGHGAYVVNGRWKEASGLNAA